jgi:hypothetical protein
VLLCFKEKQEITIRFKVYCGESWEVVLEDVGVRKNNAKVQIAREYSLTCPLIKLWNKCLWIRRSCWGRRIEFELATKAWACKINFSCKFSQLLTKKHLSQIYVSLCMSPCHEGAKWNTIGVARGISAKLPHCMGFALTYPMEKEMPFVHHVVKWWGCDCIIEHDKSLNERTQGHPMMKPMSKLM